MAASEIPEVRRQAAVEHGSGFAIQPTSWAGLTHDHHLGSRSTGTKVSAMLTKTWVMGQLQLGSSDVGLQFEEKGHTKRAIALGADDKKIARAA